MPLVLVSIGRREATMRVYVDKALSDEYLKAAAAAGLGWDPATQVDCPEVRGHFNTRNSCSHGG
jgi:hypothetical protein